MPTRPPSFRPSGYVSKAQREVSRGTRTARGYSNRWGRAAKLFLIEHPMCACAQCQARGLPLPATVVDHIVPHRGDPSLFWDASNWQPMAKRCHDRKTMSERNDRRLSSVRPR